MPCLEDMVSKDSGLLLDLWPSIPPAPSSESLSGAEGGWVGDTDVSLKVEHSTVTYSGHCGQL